MITVKSGYGYFKGLSSGCISRRFFRETELTDIYRYIKIHTHIDSLQEWTHVIVEAEKYHLSTTYACREQEASGVIQPRSEGLRIKGPMV